MLTETSKKNTNEYDSSGVTTGQIYNDYNQVVKLVESWINKADVRLLLCEQDQVKSRIAQRIVELTSEEYAKKVANTIGDFERTPQIFNISLLLNGIKINLKTGVVSVSVAQWFRHIALFAITWLHLLYVLICAIFSKCPKSSIPATLLMEAGGGYEESDDRFTEYCKQGPIAPLSSASQVIVRSKYIPSKTVDSSFSYASQPLHHLVRTCLQKKHIFVLLAQHLLTPILFFQMLVLKPIDIILAQDVAYIPIADWLDKHSLIESVIITTSSFMSQPLWMKGLREQGFKLHMVWYSQNFIPKKYIGEQARSNLPSARHMRLDVHWVWTDGFKSYLTDEASQKLTEINVIGPMLWYLPDKIESLGAAIKIAIFDITPLPDGKNAYGAIKNYYSVATIKKFVQDIVDIITTLSIEYDTEVLMLLKHKRSQHASHDSGYFYFLSEIEKKHHNFKIIDHKVNLFGLIDECDLSVSVPYTSTVSVAAELKKPAIYYDPYAELIPIFESSKFISFASGESELNKLIRKMLNNRLPLDTKL